MAVVASVGTYTGPVGSAILPSLQGAQVWVKYVNQKGGVNGHPVKLLVYDDGGDPARHKSQVQDAVERQHIIAFVQSGEGVNGKESIGYITSHRIPVIGSVGAADWFYGTSPMYFPQATHGNASFYMAIASAAQQLVPAGKAKLGTIICVEAGVCDQADNVIAKAAPTVGFQHVYKARSSVAQPDYTAECLAARNAGVETIFTILDSASIGRLGLSCARQSYKPTFATAYSLATDRQKDDPSLTGMVASTQVFPYFQAGTPATDEFQEAMRSFGGGLEPGVGPATGWVSGRLFEKAAAALPEPPTNEAVLAGLWAIKNDTLGGITQPLTFVANEPAKPLVCWFNLAIKDRSWTSPDGFKQYCRDYPG